MMADEHLTFHRAPVLRAGTEALAANLLSGGATCHICHAAVFGVVCAAAGFVAGFRASCVWQQ